MLASKRCRGGGGGIEKLGSLDRSLCPWRRSTQAPWQASTPKTSPAIIPPQPPAYPPPLPRIPLKARCSHPYHAASLSHAQVGHRNDPDGYATTRLGMLQRVRIYADG